jgi:tetratricopeptide (TPR) repeat protein
MNKNTLLGTIAGLLVGALVGFWGANYLNGGAAVLPDTAATTVNGVAAAPPSTASQSSIPPKSAAEQQKMLTQVQDKLDNAKERPDDATAQLEAGDMYIEIQRFDEALGFYSKAAELKPRSFDAHANIGRIYFEKRQYEKAGEYYEKALSIDDTNIGLRSDLGLTFFLRSPPNLERAVKEYRTALEMDAKHEPSLQNLSVALKELGEEGERTKVMERLRKVNPNNQLFTKQTSNG